MEGQLRPEGQLGLKASLLDHRPQPCSPQLALAAGKDPGLWGGHTGWGLLRGVPAPMSLSVCSLVPVTEHAGTLCRRPAPVPAGPSPRWLRSYSVHGTPPLGVHGLEKHFPAPCLPASVALWESGHSSSSWAGSPALPSMSPVLQGSGIRGALDGNCKRGHVSRRPGGGNQGQTQWGLCSVQERLELTMGIRLGSGH